MIKLVCEEDGHSKFWEAEVVGSAVTTRWGRLGTAGQEKTKSFADAAAATKDYEKLVREKRGKGYTEASGGAAGGSKAPQAAASNEKPAKQKPAEDARLAATAVKNLKQARAAVVAGDVDVALPIVEAEAAKGTASAWSILAQIRAYRGDWEGALDAASRLLADPNDIYAGNVIDDAEWIVLRAARLTGRWADAGEAIRKAKPLGSRTRSAVGDFIKKQAKAKGTLPDPVFDPPDDDRSKLTLAQRQEKYAYWMARSDEEAKKKRKVKPGEREDASWAYACGYGLDDLAMKAWPEVEATKLWDDAVKAARLFARNGREGEAWAILERKIAHYSPVDIGQIAPIEPLVDEALRTLITPERLAALLTAPKGKNL
jgi:predicted DNA-binding WGR domain protein